MFKFSVRQFMFSIFFQKCISLRSSYKTQFLFNKILTLIFKHTIGSKITLIKIHLPCEKHMLYRNNKKKINKNKINFQICTLSFHNY